MNRAFKIMLLFFSVAILSSCGKEGPEGALGPQGEPGVAGMAGIAGPAGKDGSIIYNGSTAPASSVGKVGDYYVNTSNGDFYGPRNSAGWGTPFNLRGAKGDKGDTGLKGEKGDPGVKGDKGNNGTPGVKGDKGDSGTPGVKGDKGDKGDPGVKGDKGDPGDKGDKGDPGVKGDKGDPGIKGDKGDPGNGSGGNGGVKGDKGDPGVKGDKGDPGVKGDKGDKGEPGVKGDPGIKGDKGDKGDKGETGIKGDPGVKGDKGDPGVKGDKGDTGAKGDKGDAGNNGARGSQVLSGNGSPSTALGAPGDYYLDKTNYILYGPKQSASVWGPGLLLQGKDGNANVKSFILSNYSVPVTPKTFGISVPAITKDILDNGAVLAYLRVTPVSDTQTVSWKFFPVSFPLSSGGIILTMNLDNMQPGYIYFNQGDYPWRRYLTGIDIRIVIIQGTSGGVLIRRQNQSPILFDELKAKYRLRD